MCDWFGFKWIIVRYVKAAKQTQFHSKYAIRHCSKHSERQVHNLPKLSVHKLTANSDYDRTSLSCKKTKDKFASINCVAEIKKFTFAIKANSVHHHTYIYWSKHSTDQSTVTKAHPEGSCSKQETAKHKCGREFPLLGKHLLSDDTFWQYSRDDCQAMLNYADSQKIIYQEAACPAGLLHSRPLQKRQIKISRDINWMSYVVIHILNFPKTY